MDSTYSEIIDAWIPFPVSEIDMDAVNEWYTQYSDSLSVWHSQVLEWTAQGDAGVPSAVDSPLGYLEPGTTEFNQLFNKLTSSKNNDLERVLDFMIYLP